jgi:hypothetical protein
MVNSLFNWLLMGCITLLHPFYVSKIELNHNTKDKTIEVSVRVFTDDMELTLQKFGNTSVNLNSPKNIEVVDKLINKYISEHLKITIDNKATTLNYLGFEINKESVWMYFEIPHIDKLNTIGINCKILYDYKKEQINIFQVKANGNDKSYKLENPRSFVNFKL